MAGPITERVRKITSNTSIIKNGPQDTAIWSNADDDLLVNRGGVVYQILTTADDATPVAGPVSSTDNAIARFDGTGGNVIQNSVVIVGDTGAITGVLTLNGVTPSDIALKSLTLAQFAATTSLQLKTLISDETGSGALVFANTPTLVTPEIGAATGTSLNASTTGRFGTTLVVGSPTMAALGEVSILSTTTSLSRGISNVQINSGTDSANFSAYKARGVLGTETTIVTGDILANFRGWGHDGTAYINMASMRYVSAGTIATNRVPTQIEFYTATDAAPSVLTLALTLDKAQKATFANSIVAPTSLISPAWIPSAGTAAITGAVTASSTLNVASHFTIQNGADFRFDSGSGTGNRGHITAIGNAIYRLSNALENAGVILNVVTNNTLTLVGLNNTDACALTLAGTLTLGGGTLLATSTALTNNAAAQAGTLLNAPTAGNPTKWVPVNDNGTTRYIPMW